MSTIEEIFIKNLTNEEIIAYHRLARDKKIKRTEIEAAFLQIEKLTGVYITNNKLDFDTLNTLGLKNAAIFFKEICKRYKEIYVDGIYENVSSDSQIVVNKTKVNFGLGNALYEINELLRQNFEINSSNLSDNSKEVIFQYTIAKTFSEIYYPIKDFTKGFSYKDNKLLEIHRNLSKEYEDASNRLKESESEREPFLNPNRVGSKIYTELEEGVNYLGEINYSGEILKLIHKQQ